MIYKNSLEILKNNCKMEEIDKWDDLVRIFGIYESKENELNNPWMFRGEKFYESSPLKTSLERAVDGLGKDKKEFLYKDRQNIQRFETKLMRDFQRKCHLFVKNPPQEDRWLEWMALMQHYGAPTRLLDWTYSFFIAVYFALENLKKDEKGCVWAIDSKWLGDNYTSIHKKQLKEFDPLEKREKIYGKIILDEGQKLVYAVNPSKLNDRLVIQQGVFLCPGDISKSFVENLEGNLSLPDSQDKIKGYIIPYKLRENILRNLYRMNINRGSLFPGLDGFAKSLNLWLLYDLCKD